MLYDELIKITRDAFLGKHYEPMKRNKDGLRWIKHRFPIKGGISYLEIQNREPNPLWEYLTKKCPKT